MLIRSVGLRRLPDGTHLLPVGFGLWAPSGVYAAGLTFLARDLLQRTAGRRAALAAILVGALLSAALDPRLALASGASFLLAELADFAVYTPLQRRAFLAAVLLSGTVGAALDSALFLTLAGIPWNPAGPGLVLGKLWLQLLGLPILAAVRRRLPAADPEA